MCIIYNILIVDDEIQVIKSLRRILESGPYYIFSTTNPEEAMKMLQNNNINIIVSDQRMPNITGLELMKFSKAVSPGTVRILMTGYSDMDIVISSINDGNIFYYISKPWDNDKFIEVIHRAAEYCCEQEKIATRLNNAVRDRNDLQKMLHKMKDLFTEFNQQSIKALKNVIKAKDVELYRHSERVAHYSLKIADMLCLNEQQKLSIEYASYLHDIGKIGIKDNILDKPGKLDDYEYNVIKRHPVIGAEIIREIDSLKEVSEIIYQHHERVDGEGYPLGINGSQIRIEAKIISVADAYDALTSCRVYRRELSSETAGNILRMGRNTFYDPNIVDVFLGGNQRV